MSDRLLRWNNETLIGRATSNAHYFGQYKYLVQFILDEFPKTKTRFEVIASPILHLISHSLEIGYKSNLKYFKSYIASYELICFKNWNALHKNHQIELLHKEFGNQMIHFINKYKPSKDLILQFNDFYAKSEELIKLLETNTETYRYAEKLNNTGEFNGFVIDNDKTINILDIKELYKPTITMLCYASDVFGLE